jgi:hypothetical protein
MPVIQWVAGITCARTKEEEMEEEKKNRIAAVEYTPGEEFVEATIKGFKNLNHESMSHYECEVCGKEQDLTEHEAFKAGWDYPPFIGIWGVLSPRTCGDCGIEQTAYWHVLTQGTEDIPENHMKTIQRVVAERTPNG